MHLSMWAMALMSNCCLPLTALWDKVSALEQCSHGAGCMSSPQSCQADVAFWQNLLPQVLRSPRTFPRTWTQLVSHLLGHKQNQTKYVADCCQKAHHLTSLLQQLPLLQLCIHQAGLRSLSQNLQGLSPQSGWLFPFYRSLPPLQRPLGAPHFGINPEAFCLVFFFSHYRPSFNLKRDNWMRPRLLEPSKQTVWKFTVRRWTSYWI